MIKICTVWHNISRAENDHLPEVTRNEIAGNYSDLCTMAKVFKAAICGTDEKKYFIIKNNSFSQSYEFLK